MSYKPAKSLSKDEKPIRLDNPFTPKLKAEFCAHFRKLGRKGMAAQRVGVSYQTILNHQRSDPQFKTECDDAYRLFCEETIEAEIHRRGIEGYQEPIFGRDADGATTRVGWVTRYSDRLLEKYASRHMPEYANRMEVKQETEITGTVDSKISLDMASLSRESRDQLREILQREVARDGASGDADSSSVIEE